MSSKRPELSHLWAIRRSFVSIRGVVEVRFDCRRRATESCSDLGDREPVGFAEVARQRHRLPVLEHPVVPSQLSTGGHVSQVLRTVESSPAIDLTHPALPATRRVRMSVPRAPSGPKEIAQRRLPRVRGRSVGGAKRAALLRFVPTRKRPSAYGHAADQRRASTAAVLLAAASSGDARDHEPYPPRRVSASAFDRAPLARIEVALQLIGLAHAR